MSKLKKRICRKGVPVTIIAFLLFLFVAAVLPDGKLNDTLFLTAPMAIFFMVFIPAFLDRVDAGLLALRCFLAGILFVVLRQLERFLIYAFTPDFLNDGWFLATFIATLLDVIPLWLTFLFLTLPLFRLANTRLKITLPALAVLGVYLLVYFLMCYFSPSPFQEPNLESGGMLSFLELLPSYTPEYIIWGNIRTFLGYLFFFLFSVRLVHDSRRSAPSDLATP